MGTCPKCKLRIRKNGNHLKLRGLNREIAVDLFRAGERFSTNPELANLAEHTRSSDAPSLSRPFPRNQLPMPSQQRVGRRDGGDLPQGRTA